LTVEILMVAVAPAVAKTPKTSAVFASRLKERRQTASLRPESRGPPR